MMHKDLKETFQLSQTLNTGDSYVTVCNVNIEFVCDI